jgi:hypothetical protein
MGVLMCASCATTTPQLPISACHAPLTDADSSDTCGLLDEDDDGGPVTPTMDKALAPASAALPVAGYAAPVEDYVHQAYLTRRAWSAAPSPEGVEVRHALYSCPVRG